MHNVRWAVIAGVAAVLWMAVGARAGQSWEYRDGRWQQIVAPTTQLAPEPVLDEAETLLSRRLASPAKKMLLEWLLAHKEHPQRDRALYLMGEAYFQDGDRIWAFYQLDELLDGFPDSRFFYPALQKQYDIAEAFLQGFKRKLFWMPILGAEDEAIEMLYRIQQRSPGSPLAEKALLRTADYYYSDAQYDLASDAYAAYAKSYPRSPVIDTVRLRQAFSYYAQFRGIRFDPTCMTDARAQLVDLIKEYPDLARSENLPAFVERIDETFARKAYYTADYFRRTGEPRAAAYYYQYIATTFPTSPEADLSRAALQKLPPEYLTPLSLYPTTTPATTPTSQPEAK